MKSDQKIIQKALKNNGHDVTLGEAKMLWEEYSNDLCAGWMTLPNEEITIYNCLKDKLTLLNEFRSNKK